MLRTIKRQVASCVVYMVYHVEQSIRSRGYFEMKFTVNCCMQCFCCEPITLHYSFLHAAWTLCLLNLPLRNYYVYLTKLSHVVVYSESSVAVCIMRSEPPFWVGARVLAFW